VKKVQAAVEKTTLGDLSALAELKANLEEAEGKPTAPKKAPAKKAAAKEEAAE
jgi:small subunit ribosomal protein S1